MQFRGFGQVVDADLLSYIYGQLPDLLANPNIIRVNQAQYDFRFESMEECFSGLGRMRSDEEMPGAAVQDFACKMRSSVVYPTELMTWEEVINFRVRDASSKFYMRDQEGVFGTVQLDFQQYLPSGERAKIQIYDVLPTALPKQGSEGI